MGGSNYWGYLAFLSEDVVNHLEKARGEICPKRSEQNKNKKQNKKKNTKMRTKVRNKKINS